VHAHERIVHLLRRGARLRRRTPAAASAPRASVSHSSSTAASPRVASANACSARRAPASNCSSHAAALGRPPAIVVITVSTSSSTLPTPLRASRPPRIDRCASRATASIRSAVSPIKRSHESRSSRTRTIARSRSRSSTSARRNASRSRARSHTAAAPSPATKPPASAAAMMDESATSGDFRMGSAGFANRCGGHISAAFRSVLFC
jgi:hypothetical protein